MGDNADEPLCQDLRKNSGSTNSGENRRRYERRTTWLQSRRSTVDLIFAVKQLQEKHYEYAIDLLMALLDIEKAYDSVRKSKVWNYLENREVPKQTIWRVR